MNATDSGFDLAGLCVDVAPQRPRGATSVNIIDKVSLRPVRSRTTAIVGESGCGKSLMALALMGLVDAPLQVRSGTLRVGDRTFALSDKDAVRPLRGDQLAMVFQEPMSALNPVFTIGEQIVEAIVTHAEVGAAAARVDAVGWLKRVGLPDPQRAVDKFPHELSGGMKQRAMIAMALAPKPDVLIADEPTTALDVTVQGQVLRLLGSLQAEIGLTVLLITHDLALVARHAQHVAIMYAGRIVETASVRQLFANPQHPYTRALLKCMPARARRGEPLATISGAVPNPNGFVAGCRFAPRCEFVTEACATVPPASQVEDEHLVYCWNVGL